MLTMPSYMGYEGINPLTVHYCYKKDGERELAWVVLEVRACFRWALIWNVEERVPGIVRLVDSQYVWREACACPRVRRRRRRGGGPCSRVCSSFVCYVFLVLTAKPHAGTSTSGRSPATSTSPRSTTVWATTECPCRHPQHLPLPLTSLLLPAPKSASTYMRRQPTPHSPLQLQNRTRQKGSTRSAR